MKTDIYRAWNLQQYPAENWVGNDKKFDRFILEWNELTIFVVGRVPICGIVNIWTRVTCLLPIKMELSDKYNKLSTDTTQEPLAQKQKNWVQKEKLKYGWNYILKTEYIGIRSVYLNEAINP